MNKNVVISHTYSFFEKFLWRSVFLFVVFYTIPHSLSFGFTIPYDTESWNLWDKPVIWIGETFFGWSFDLENLYKGFDSKYEFCFYILITSLAFICSLLWIRIDRFFKKEYDYKFKILVQNILRYYIGITIIHYGISKVILLQFGTIGISTMDEIIGDQTPMGFMWNFLSFSKTVSFFTGWAEVIGGVLLFFRKTTFLGCLILFGIILSVVIMDIGYDVSVALYAIQLLVLVMILLSDQFKSMYNYILLGKTSKAVVYPSLFKTTRFAKAAPIFKYVLFIILGILYVKEYSTYYKTYIHNENRWFTAKHTVDAFVLNSDTLSIKNDNNTKRWETIIFNGYSYFPETFELITADGKSTRYKFQVDSTKRRIKYHLFENEEEVWDSLQYDVLGNKNYSFQGIFKGDTIKVKTNAKYPEDYLLIKANNKFIFDLE